MDFANILLLFGGLLFALPLVIHLLNRSKFDTIPWAAMHLLQSIPQQNQRRWKWQRWLLLAVRCLIPLLLALCMARPLLTAWRTSSSGTMAMSVILDDSYSMQAPSATSPQQTATQSAKSQLNAFLRQASGSGDQFALLQAGRVPRTPETGFQSDTSSLSRKLNEWLPTESGFNCDAALAAATGMLLETHYSDRQILIVSDFQSADWSNLSVLQLWRDEHPEIHCLLLPADSDKTSNLQVQLDHRYTETIGLGETLEIRVQITNHSLQPQTQVAVTVHVDDQPLTSRQVDVPANASSELIFPCQFAEAGDHQVQVQLEDSGWPSDNQDQMTVRVIEELNVLLIDGATSADRNLASAFYWELALRATATAGQQSPWLRIRRSSRSQLQSEWMEMTDVIVLANVTTVDPELQTRLSAQVAAGKGLLVLAGPGMDTASYNQWRVGQEDVLPATLGDWINKEIRPRSAPYPHPALAFFNQDSETFADIAFHQISELQTRPTAQTVIEMGDGSPWIVSGRFKAGRIAIIASGANQVESDLVLSPLFVPFTQRWILSLAGEASEQTRFLSPEESNADYLDPQQRSDLAEALGATWVKDAQQLQTTIATHKSGWEVWRYVLLGLIIFLFVELLIQRPFSEGAV